MRGTVIHGPRDIRYEERPAPEIIAPTDAVIRMSATCVCGSDLWPYRGANAIKQPTPMGHEYVGVVEEVGSAVKNVKPGQFVIDIVGEGYDAAIRSQSSPALRLFANVARDVL